MFRDQALGLDPSGTKDPEDPDEYVCGETVRCVSVTVRLPDGRSMTVQGFPDGSHPIFPDHEDALLAE